MSLDNRRQRAADLRARREAYLRSRYSRLGPEPGWRGPIHSRRRRLYPPLMIVSAVAFSLVAALDVLRVLAGTDRLESLSNTLIIVGLVAGLPAAVIGTSERSQMPIGSAARRAATWRGVGNIVALVLIVAGWLTRTGDQGALGVGSLLLVWSGTVVMLVTGMIDSGLPTQPVARLGFSEDDRVEACQLPATTLASPAPPADERQIAHG